MQRTLFWQFFGPDSGRTAAHFHEHLLEFLVRSRLDALETGVIGFPGQGLVFGSFDGSASLVVERALRPKGGIDGGLPDDLRAAFDTAQG